MIESPHLQTAIAAYQSIGREFHDVLVWHLLHGLVLAFPAFLCLAHFCRRDDLATPLPHEQADTVFVTFMTGDMRALRAACPAGLDFIAFERGFQTDRPAKVYPMAKFQQLTH